HLRYLFSFPFINSSFLPKQQPANVGEIPGGDTSKDEASIEKDDDGAQDPEDIDKRKTEQIAEVAKKLEERPLAKAQEQLEERQNPHTDTERQDSTVQRKAPNEAPIIDVKPVLNEDDRELDRVEALLCETHRRFYERYDAHLQGHFPLLPDVSPGTAKAEMALKRGNIFVVEMKWFDNSIIRWRRQPEKDYLIDRKRGTPRSITPEIMGRSEGKFSESSNTLQQTLQPSDVTDQVSALEGAGGDGTNGKSSHSKDSQEKVNQGDGADSLAGEEEAGEVEAMELNIDWAQIDKELEDELGSDIDEESETGSHAGVLTDDGTPDDMEDVKSTSRGIKRRRSQTSTPTTPSKLRLSTTIPYKEGTPSPPNSKKKRVEEIVKEKPNTDGAGRKDEQSTESGPSQDDASISNTQGPNDTEEDDDDDDFLAREMAEGGETDEWDSSDDA
ncbi:16965_t:CDS:2, partial [Acaulospora colombiana]